MFVINKANTYYNSHPVFWTKMSKFQKWKCDVRKIPIRAFVTHHDSRILQALTLTVWFQNIISPTSCPECRLSNDSFLPLHRPFIMHEKPEYKPPHMSEMTELKPLYMTEMTEVKLLTALWIQNIWPMCKSLEESTSVYWPWATPPCPVPWAWSSASLSPQHSSDNTSTPTSLYCTQPESFHPTCQADAGNAF